MAIVTLKATFFQDVTLDSRIQICQGFTGACCIPPHYRIVGIRAETSLSFYLDDGSKRISKSLLNFPQDCMALKRVCLNFVRFETFVDNKVTKFPLFVAAMSLLG